MFEPRKKPQISIVIPSWFTPEQHGQSGELETFWFAVECMHRLVETIKDERDRYEIILVDNGSYLTSKAVSDTISKEGSRFPAWHYANKAEYLARFNPDVYWALADVLIRNKVNLGFGPACNQGFAVARGDYVVCLNNDILVWPGWADRMIEPFSLALDNPKVGIVMPALIKETSNPFEAILLKDISLTANYDRLGPHAEFGSMWVAKRELLKEVAKNRDGYQVFDEEFKGFFKEDRWLYKEVRDLGYETYRTHKTRVYHRGNMTVSKVPDRKKYSAANRELFEKRMNQGDNN